MKIKKIILITLGCISLGVGCVGIALPILPTTPFFLLTLICFTNSSERLHNWFVGTKLYKKNGEMVANKHYREQAEMLKKLRLNGYIAEFAIGYKDAIEQIHEYLGEPIHKKVEF